MATLQDGELRGGTAMSATEIVRFVKDNAYRPDTVAAHWHRVTGRLTDFAICVASPDLGYAYKVDMGEVPEHTIIDPTTQGILVRGWRGLFVQMIADGVMRVTPAVRQKLGNEIIDQLQKGGQGVGINEKWYAAAEG